jgi:hypothetical protein
VSLVQDFERKGVVLTPKLAFRSEAPMGADTLALLKEHKAGLLRDLILPDTVPRLPWQLDGLVNAAASGVLDAEVPGVPDVPVYVMGWACAYLTGRGDHAEALRRLWEVYRAWEARRE